MWERDHWACEQNKNESKKTGPTNNGSEEKSVAGNDVKTKRSVSFHKVKMTGPICSTTPNIDTLLDDGAPYCGIGLDEFRMIQLFVSHHWNGRYNCLPTSIAHTPNWQYGNGQHASAFKRIIGSVLFNAQSDRGQLVRINHLIIKGF